MSVRLSLHMLSIAIFYELLALNNYIDNCHLMVHNVYVDLKFLNQAPLYNKNIILLDCGTLITLINNCMQMFGHTLLSN
jgi:hypothetical protein